MEKKPLTLAEASILSFLHSARFLIRLTCRITRGLDMAGPACTLSASGECSSTWLQLGYPHSKAASDLDLKSPPARLTSFTKDSTVHISKFQRSFTTKQNRRCGASGAKVPTSSLLHLTIRVFISGRPSFYTSRLVSKVIIPTWPAARNRTAFKTPEGLLPRRQQPSQRKAGQVLFRNCAIQTSGIVTRLKGQCALYL